MNLTDSWPLPTLFWKRSYYVTKPSFYNRNQVWHYDDLNDEDLE
jgi:hypothetical protein